MERFKFESKIKIIYGIPNTKGMTITDAKKIAMDIVVKNAPAGYVFEDDYLTFIGMETEEHKTASTLNNQEHKCPYCGCPVPTDSLGNPLQYCDC